MAEMNAVPIRIDSNMRVDMAWSSPHCRPATAVGFRQGSEEQPCEEEDSDQDCEGIGVLHVVPFAISQKDSIIKSIMASVIPG